jgi:hypothetical protein
MGLDYLRALQKTCNEQANEALKERRLDRKDRWTESIAVRREGFVAETKVKSGIRGRGHHVYGEGNSFQLKEPEGAYTSDFDPENGVLSFENTYLRDDIC